MSAKNIHFAKWIKLFLKRSQLSVRQLAILSGLEHASIGQYKRGERLPRNASLIYLTKAISKYEGLAWKDVLFEAIEEIEKDI